MIEAEWGGDVGFLDADRIIVSDSEGNDVGLKCACGKKAIGVVMGKGTHQGFCSKCFYRICYAVKS